VEITTEADQPVETRNAERSWFGVAEVLYAKDSGGAEPPAAGVSLHDVCKPAESAPGSREELASRYVRALRHCVEAWKEGRITDEEADFLGQFVRLDLLPNKLGDLPAAAQLIAEYRRLEAEVPVPTRAPGVLEGFPQDQPLFVRGDHKKLGEVVPRRFLEAIDPRPLAPAEKRSGRLELAERFLVA
jgi:hypothetical protein